MSYYTQTSLTELASKFTIDRETSVSNYGANTLTGSGTIYLIEVDNELNAGSVYLKIVDGTSASISTTTDNGAGTPDYMFKVAGHSKLCITVPGGISLSTGLSYWVTTSATVGNTADPSSAVSVKFLSA
tara:strand:+ start:312 stop:698 length:387 start_codon:yes stop_codon:yes gene_type:complete